MLSEKAFNLDQSKILLFGKELRKKVLQSVNYLQGKRPFYLQILLNINPFPNNKF